jgi:hypothetical protein
LVRVAQHLQNLSKKSEGRGPKRWLGKVDAL